MYIISAIVIVLLLLLLSGPRVKTPVSKRKAVIPEIDKLVDFIKSREDGFDDIREDANAQIRWFNGVKKTSISILYLHGFTACRMETEPLTSNLADSLKANVFFARLSGHGRTFDAMGEPDAGDWLRDVEEGYDIAKKIGDRVIVIGTSTGGTLAAYLADKFPDDSIYIMISPNFGPRDQRAESLLWPWGKYMGLAISGKYRWWKIQNEMHEKYWTWRYPTTALLPMMALVRYGRKISFENIKQSVLIFYSNDDNVVNQEYTKTIFEKLGSTNKKMIEITHSQDRDNHVLAGDALSPNTTDSIHALILDYIETIKT